MLSDQELKTLCHVWQELNAIRARDGAPSGVSEEWWDKLTERVKDIVESNCDLQHGVHCHPFLYKKYDELSDHAK